VLVISNYDGDEDIHQALAAGAMGYLFKSVVEDELVDAIREINAGRSYLPKGVAARLGENKSGAHLTRREEEILELLGKGLGNRELGQVLGVSEDTIKTHLKSLFRKLDVSNRAEAVREGLRRGFIHSEAS
jgi:two-component system, NarL family, response regulator